ncbi:metal ABC transporter substrate-binding protein [Aromatoleum bremense]|uniref:Zinc ABC transporter solute-binding protein n=1 Tax=Aromatoleum bremense TaxID=76115 RepID=A0ABX1P0T7_9RHOO|nr:metal ABC transporter substrate-binding protein [Aromatoleum bremense]NMG17330.1 zinc ABC transporter solute-binding protein [Aromatoleum bremense]QTQ32526.1 Putative ABC transporter periplasmic binding protein [Aromatoleum bremense]
MNHLKIALLAALAFGLALVSPALRAAPLEVVASFSILGDFVSRVGGERVAVTTLVGAGADAHNYQPRPSDARRLGNARLIVANGLGFDEWIQRLAQSAGYQGTVLIASAGIRPLAEEDEHGHAHEGAVDPHAWQDVSNAIRYVANIAEALIRTDPAGAAVYRQNAARYTAELEALDATIRRTLATVPTERRKVVSSHDAFGYFSHAYDVRFLAAAGISTQSEPSASGIAQLIRQLRREKPPAVFVESISDPRLAERISHESGARLGGTLYSDALSNADGPAPTYLDMMRHNLKTLMEGLTSAP